MFEKYRTEFEDMHERISLGESPTDVIGDYGHICEQEGIGPIGLASYLMNITFEEKLEKEVRKQNL